MSKILFFDLETTGTINGEWASVAHLPYYNMRNM